MISNCFEIIDKNAKKVLESDEFEDISLELLEDIIRRDGLELPSGIAIRTYCIHEISALSSNANQEQL